MTPFPSPAASRVEEAVLTRASRRWVEQLEHGRPPSFQVLEPAFAAALAGSWPHADSPELARSAARVSARALMSARLEAALEQPVTAGTIAALVGEVVAIDASVLDRPGRLRYVLLCDRVSAWGQAQAAAALAAYVGPCADADADPAAEARRDRALRLEVRVARRISDDAAARDIEAARRLAAELRPVREAWSAGTVSFRHVAAFLDRTRLCRPDLTGAVLDHIGDRLTSTPSTRIGSVIDAALAALDPRGQAGRARHARRHEVGVTQRTLADGLGQITLIDKVEVTRAMIERIDDDADRVLLHSHQCEACAVEVPAELGPARAAALRSLFFAQQHAAVARQEGHVHDPADVAQATSRRSRRGELQVVVDLATLLGLADNPGLLAGQPVPADLARELAAECGSLRRIVTDPVDGHLLDYGTRTYLPQALKDHVAARDGTCRAPGCGQPARRCEMDHVIPFPHGPSAAGNTAMLCKRDHTVKTHGDLRITEHLPDGTTRWATRDGQTGVTPPRSYLPDVRRRRAPGRDDDPPPF